MQKRNRVPVPGDIKTKVRWFVLYLNSLEYIYRDSPLTNSMAPVMDCLQHGEYAQAIEFLDDIKSDLLGIDGFREMSAYEKSMGRNDAMFNPEVLADEISDFMELIEKRYQ